MNILAALATLSIFAWGEGKGTADSEVRIEPGLAHAADVIYTNNSTYYTDGNSLTFDMFIETVGVVTIRIDMRNNYPCNDFCGDTMTVIALPEGFYAYPEDIYVDEHSEGVIELHEEADMLLGSSQSVAEADPHVV